VFGLNRGSLFLFSPFPFFCVVLTRSLIRTCRTPWGSAPPPSFPPAGSQPFQLDKGFFCSSFTQHKTGLTQWSPFSPPQLAENFLLFLFLSFQPLPTFLIPARAVVGFAGFQCKICTVSSFQSLQTGPMCLFLIVTPLGFNHVPFITGPHYVTTFITSKSAGFYPFSYF